MNRITIPGSTPPDDGGKVAPKRDKTAQVRTEERERRFRAMQAGFRAIVSEMKRVTWPSREEWVSATLVTVGLVVVVAVWTTAIGRIAEWIFGAGQ